VSESVIEDGRGRNENRFPVSFSQQKCARIARNSISHAFIVENANEMRLHAVPKTFPFREMRTECANRHSSRTSSRKTLPRPHLGPLYESQGGNMKSVRRIVNHYLPTISGGIEPDSPSYELQSSALPDSRATGAAGEWRAPFCAATPLLRAFIRRCNTYGYVDVRAMDTRHAHH